MQIDYSVYYRPRVFCNDFILLAARDAKGGGPCRPRRRRLCSSLSPFNHSSLFKPPDTVVMTNEGPPPSIAGPTPAAQPSQPARSPTSSSTKPATLSRRPTAERRPPANIAGPTYKRQGTSGPPIRQDTSETTNTSAEPARKKEEKKVWGLGGVFPEREKRGMKEEKKEGSQARPPPQERQASAAPTGTESYYYSPELEREDPFNSRKTREASYDNEEVQSREASRPPSPTRSRSSTICDEEAPEPSKDSKEAAHDDEQNDSIEGKNKESRPQGPGHESTNNEQSDGQVGGHLPADESGWEDQLDLDDEDPPVKSWWGSVRFALREPLAEWLGMLVLIVFGIGSNCQVNLSNNTVSFASPFPLGFCG